MEILIILERELSAGVTDLLFLYHCGCCFDTVEFLHSYFATMGMFEFRGNNCSRALSLDDVEYCHFFGVLNYVNQPH